jgi:ABC-type multidrug transport system ATPase subunit
VSIRSFVGSFFDRGKRAEGIPNNVIDQAVTRAIIGVGIDKKAANRQCSTYSGGMKRKLAVAISLVSKRKIVIMDEPSTRVDPSSRRFMWYAFCRC